MYFELETYAKIENFIDLSSLTENNIYDGFRCYPLAKEAYYFSYQQNIQSVVFVHLLKKTLLLSNIP